MNDKLYIPKVLKVGYQNRNDTYSGRLAYVTYLDEKNKHRKFMSWDGWCSKEGREDLTNEPMAGFVLNRDVGGTRRSYGWDARIEKVRVFDPRGFEIEISIPNLLFIMQECSSIKGKGLEGEFVYSWAGAELVLLPVGCKAYKDSTQFTDLQSKKFGIADLKEGYLYLTKDKVEVIYLGRHDWLDITNVDTWYKLPTFTAKALVFVKTGEKKDEDFLVLSASKIGFQLSDDVHPDYAESYIAVMKYQCQRTPKRLVLKPYEKNEYVRHFCMEYDGELCVIEKVESAYYHFKFLERGYYFCGVIRLGDNGKIKLESRERQKLSSIEESDKKDVWLEFEDGSDPYQICIPYDKEVHYGNEE